MSQQLSRTSEGYPQYHPQRLKEDGGGSLFLGPAEPTHSENLYKTKFKPIFTTKVRGDVSPQISKF